MIKTHMPICDIIERTILNKWMGIGLPEARLGLWYIYLIRYDVNHHIDKLQTEDTKILEGDATDGNY